MTDEEFYAMQRKIDEGSVQATLEQMASWLQGQVQASPEQLARWSAGLANCPYEVKRQEIEARTKREAEMRFTRWCRGARKWEE